MENISLSGKTNFFEKRVGDYQKAGVMEKQAKRVAAEKGEAREVKNGDFSFEEDF